MQKAISTQTITKIIAANVYAIIAFRRFILFLIQYHSEIKLRIKVG